jgi:hypothetical protein
MILPVNLKGKVCIIPDIDFELGMKPIERPKQDFIEFKFHISPWRYGLVSFITRIAIFSCIK